MNKILSEREKTHGSFNINASYAQGLKRIMHVTQNWGALSTLQKEALEMIMHKIARILAGDANHKDHWDDISGYAQLVSIELEELSK